MHVCQRPVCAYRVVYRAIERSRLTPTLTLHGCLGAPFLLSSNHSLPPTSYLTIIDTATALNSHMTKGNHVLEKLQLHSMAPARDTPAMAICGTSDRGCLHVANSIDVHNASTSFQPHILLIQRLLNLSLSVQLTKPETFRHSSARLCQNAQ